MKALFKREKKTAYEKEMAKIHLRLAKLENEYESCSNPHRELLLQMELVKLNCRLTELSELLNGIAKAEGGAA